MDVPADIILMICRDKYLDILDVVQLKDCNRRYRRIIFPHIPSLINLHFPLQNIRIRRIGCDLFFNFSNGKFIWIKASRIPNKKVSFIVGLAEDSINHVKITAMRTWKNVQERLKMVVRTPSGFKCGWVTEANTYVFRSKTRLF